jgi:hypothetical protein
VVKAGPNSRERTAKMVPLYAARIEDLGPGDFLKIDCTGCCRRLLRSSAEHRWSQTVLLSTAFMFRLDLRPRDKVVGKSAA